MTQQPDLRPRQTADLHARPLGDELLIYAPAQGTVHILNATARVIWEACDGSQTPAAMTRRLIHSFTRAPDHTPGQDVMDTLHELHRLRLIDWT